MLEGVEGVVEGRRKREVGLFLNYLLGCDFFYFHFPSVKRAKKDQKGPKRTRVKYKKS